MANPGSTAALPYDLNPVDGWEERFVPVDKCDFICYPGFRGCIFRTDAVALSGTGAGVFSPTFAQLLGEVVIQDGFTGTITLPTTTEWYRYLTRIKCFFPSNDDPENGELRRWWVEERFANMSDLNVTINTGDANTTFPDGTTSFSLPPGISVFRLRPLTGGLAPTMILEPESGAALITTFCDLPTYPLPGNDDDEIIICNDGAPENISRENFVNFTGAANNAIMGPNSRYAMTGTGNTGLGEDSFGALTTGSNNVALGFGVMDATSIGNGNTGIGAQALGALTTGTNNTAIGVNALDAATATTGNVAIGNDALGGTVSGSSNVGIGDQVAMGAITGNNNVYIGSAAGPAVASSAADNIAIGRNAMDAVTTGTPNIAMGQDSLGALTTGVRNVAIGSATMALSTTSTDSVAIGPFALDAVTTGSSNIAIGTDALGALTTGTGNVAVGTTNSVLMTTGASNTGVGAGSLAACTTGTGNICYGFQSGNAITTGQNNIVVGNNNGGTGTGQQLTTELAVTMIGIGINAAPGGNTRFFINPTLRNADTANLQYNVATGELTNPTSSRVFKDDIVDIDVGLESLDKLLPRSFILHDKSIDKDGKIYNKHEGRPKYGFIADEVAKVHPKLAREGAVMICDERVNGGDNVPMPGEKYCDIDDRAIIAYLAKCVKDLKAEVDALKAKV